MKNKELSPTDYQLYLLKSLLWLSLAWGGFALTLIGFFHAWIVWLFFLASAVWLTNYSLKKKLFLKPSKEMFFSSLAFIIIVIVFSLFSTPTVFTGRDQGSFSEAAIRLSQNHKIEFSNQISTEFFKLHEPGRALNFPGFYYNSQGNLTTQFPLVYIAWLALFFSVFGIMGFTIANAILLFIFFISLYLLSRLFLKSSAAAFPTTIFAATSFIFMWFSKMTLSENMALPLLWTAILSLMLFLKNQRNLYYIIFLMTASLLCFTRIEGVAFLLMAILVLAINKNVHKYFKSQFFFKLFLPIILFAIFFIFNFIKDFYFYKEIAKAILPNLSTPKAKYLGEINGYVLPEFYIQKVFYIYGLLGFFLVGTASIIKSFWKKELYALVPFFITLPTFIYFIDDHISPDHPWLLRRFMFSIAPVAIFYSGLLLGNWLEKKQNTKLKLLSLLITIVLLVGNLPAFSKYLTFSENKNLLQQTETFGKQFSDNDLILIDQKTTGDNWAMISGPLNSIYQKNAIYFFNIQDLSKLNTDNFDNVYLVTPNSQISFYLNSTIGLKLVETNTYTLNTNRLDTKPETSSDKISLPEKKYSSIQGKIFKIEK